MTWKCVHCGEENEAELNLCWCCGHHNGIPGNLK
jgi:hypothetical protein